jgi:ABC-type nitrate/sulfonate/bicarbonate transport system permease component
VDAVKGPLLLAATIVGLGLAWQAAAMTGWIDTATVPPPDEILASLPQLVLDENLAGRFVTTFLEALCAAALAILLGVPLGWALHRSRLAGLAFEPWAAGLAAAPLVLLYPLFLVLVGRNLGTIVIMGAVAGLPAMVLKTKEGFDSIRPVLRHVARSYGFGERAVFAKVLLPAAVPTLANGVRLALVFALINIVGVEFLVNFGGLGQLIADLSDRYELPAMYGAVLFVILISTCFFVLTERLEQWLRPA